MMFSLFISLSDLLTIKRTDSGRAHANDVRIAIVQHGRLGRRAGRWWSDHLSHRIIPPPPCRAGGRPGQDDSGSDSGRIRRRRVLLGGNFITGGDGKATSRTCGQGDRNPPAGWPLSCPDGERCLTATGLFRLRSGNLETPRGQSINLLGNGPLFIRSIHWGILGPGRRSRTLCRSTGSALAERS